jgi:hypothetical protein
MGSSTGSLTELPGPCGKNRPLIKNNGQFDRLTDRITRALRKKPDPELVEGSGQQEMS